MNGLSLAAWISDAGISGTLEILIFAKFCFRHGYIPADTFPNVFFK